MDQFPTDIRLLPIGKLRVDHSYQRDLDEGWMRWLYDNWKPSLAGVLIVSSRDDGDLVVLDGQHRLTTVRALLADHVEGIEQSMWCEVYFGLTFEQEARMFMGRNNAKPIHTLYKFKARIAAGETTATTINAILIANGTRTAFNAREGYACVVVMEKVLGWQVLEPTINIIERAWPADELSLAAQKAKHSRQVVEGMGIFLRTHLDNDAFDHQIAIKRLGERINLVRMLENARNEARASNVNQSVTVARTLRDAYNIHAKHRLSEVLPPKGYRA